MYQTARQVGELIFGSFGIDYSDAAVRAILTKLDFVDKQVKPVPAKADGQQQQAFVKAFEALIEDLPQDTVVYFTDPTHPTHNTQTAKAWIKKGQENPFRPTQAEKGLTLLGLLMH